MLTTFIVKVTAQTHTATLCMAIAFSLDEPSTAPDSFPSNQSFSHAVARPAWE
jgi:hypothetical protein